MATLTTRRKRVKEVVVPEAGTPERAQWDERQLKLQQQHADSFVKQKELEARAYKALRERRRTQRRRDLAGGTLFGDEDIPPRPVVPPRGPKTHGNRVIADGQVPVKRDRRKSKTKVEAARERAHRGE
jgi:hypothetical protein